MQRDLELAAHYYFLGMRQGDEVCRDSFLDILSRGEVNWKTEYHTFWNSDMVEDNGKLVYLDDQIMCLLLISHNRKFSKYEYLEAFVKGISMNVIKFLCHARQAIEEDDDEDEEGEDEE